MSDVKTWRYSLPSIDGEGWAVIFLDSIGTFSAVSDYGNYGNLWSNHGCADVRHFMAKERGSYDYFVGKLSSGKVYDGDATYEAILKEIAEREARGELSKDAAAAERDLLEEHEYVDASEDLVLWHEETTMIDIDMTEIPQQKHPSGVRAFCERILPRLATAIRAELEAEKAADA